jgi:UDP:flavonoid glycosyltransferase YjiC (YdhE family)
MKILHVLDHSVPVSDGYAFRSLNIIREQRKRGWDPVILTSPKHEQGWGGNVCSEEHIDGLKYFRSGSSGRNKTIALSELKLMKRLGARIAQVVDAEKPDLIHAHSPVLNVMPALWIGRRRKIPVIYEIRAFWEDAGVDQGTYKENAGNLGVQACRSSNGSLCRT